MRLRTRFLMAPLWLLFSACGPEAPDAVVPVPDRSAVPLAGCAKGKTVTELETNFISPTCGQGSGSCHATGLFKPNLKDLPIYTKLFDTKPDKYCPSNKLIDSKTPDNSLVLVKISQALPTCPGTKVAAGDQMPWKMPALSTEDMACMTAYIQAVATGR